jgi:hypothetical protein
MTRNSLDNLLLENVIDLRFARRHIIPGRPATRRILCTKSSLLLNSPNGRVVLNYKPPTHAKKINESQSNVCVVWDIIMQDYRTISAEQVNILRVIPGNDEFWTFFNNEIYIMSAAQKILYMDS